MIQDLKVHREREEQAQKEGKQLMLPKHEIDTLLKKKTIVDSSIHPDTGKPVSWVMRMCAFVPTNLPIIFGMLMTKQTPVSTAFWQWLN